MNNNGMDKDDKEEKAGLTLEQFTDIVLAQVRNIVLVQVRYIVLAQVRTRSHTKNCTFSEVKWQRKKNTKLKYSLLLSFFLVLP